MSKNLEKEAQVFIKTASEALHTAAAIDQHNSEHSKEVAKTYQKYVKSLNKIASNNSGHSGQKLDSILSEFLQKPVGVGKDVSRTAAISEATSKILFSPDNNVPLLAEAIGTLPNTEHYSFFSSCFGGGDHN